MMKINIHRISKQFQIIQEFQQSCEGEKFNSLRILLCINASKHGSYPGSFFNTYIAY